MKKLPHSRSLDSGFLVPQYLIIKMTWVQLPIMLLVTILILNKNPYLNLAFGIFNHTSNKWDMMPFINSTELYR